MIKPKFINNVQTYDCSDNSFTQKKEEKNNSRISLIEPVFQPILIKSDIYNKK